MNTRSSTRPRLPPPKGLVLYHGTSRDGAASLIEAQTFDPSRLQKRDHGFFGEGFYCATTLKHARSYSGVILAVELKTDAKILDAVEGPGITPKHVPSYHKAFARHYRDKVMRFRNDDAIADRAVEEVTPPFDDGVNVGSRYDYYRYVTSWVRETGAYDGVAWGPEVIITNPSAIASIRRVAAPRKS